MDDPRPMRRRQRARDLGRIAERFFERQGLGRDQPAQGSALDILHGDEIYAAFLRNVVNRDDVGVIQRRGRPGLLHEAAFAFRISNSLRRQDFDGHETVQVSDNIPT